MPAFPIRHVRHFGAFRVNRRYFPVVLGMAACLVASAALAAILKKAGSGNGVGGTGEVVFLVEVALLLLVGRGLGEIMQRFGQPAVIGQLLAGLILGPSLFGWIWPEAHHLIFPNNAEQKNLLTGLSDIGVMMLLLLTGMETDLKLVRKIGAPAIAVSITGVAVPFLCGFTAVEFLPISILADSHNRLITALFVGTALSISSIKIVAMVVREMNFMRRNLGQIIVASAIMEDTIGWVIIALTLGIAGAGGFAVGSLAKTVIGTALFLILSYTIGRRLVFWLIRWVNDTFVSEYAVVTAILIVMCAMALVTQAIGVNTVLGAFVAGVLVGESPILSQHIEDQLRGLITAFMMPIFFGMSGLSADLTILKDPHFALLTLGLVAIASLGKFAGAFSGGMISGLSSRESLALGCGMNARGSTEVIVASIGLAMGALTQNIYTMIVTMAVITTMAMPPMLRWALGRLPVDKDEQARLEKEDLDAKGFVGRLERLLIAADDSANGRFASRLAGFLAGQRGMPVTVLHLSEEQVTRTNTNTEDATAKLKEVTTESAKEGHRAAKEETDGARPDKVEVSARVEKTETTQALAKESEKGYDLLFVGVERMRKPDGTFSAAVERIAAGFEGPLALTMSDKDATALSAKAFNILVPVNGTEASRRGAELAFSLSPATDGKVTALHVAQRAGTGERARRGSTRRKAEKAVLDDTAALGRRYGYDEIQIAVRTNVEPDAAIIAEANRIRADLIVIGASRRIGDTFYVGQTIANVLAQWKGAIVLVVA
jgi:Kef-type K+ transport system membrane component KefB/nucleotide-binding universal stress UspA family protein